MLRRTVLAMSAATLVCLPLLSNARAETIREEASEHPRIVKAVNELEDAIKYMEAAPHDFGGHKAEAIAASRKAIEQLRKALAYRARHDK